MKKIINAFVIFVLIMFSFETVRAENGVTKMEKSELKKRLTPLQYKVTQEEGTEPPFNNEYWDNKHEGIYVDIVDGTALFASIHKYDSKTGWPSFFQPLDESSIKIRKDTKLWMVRLEVSSAKSGTHLGHVFDDGPGPTGKRYCINSASLRFVPKEKLKEEGLSKYLDLFESK